MTLFDFPRQSCVAFVLAFPQRKLLITECKDTQVTYVEWNLLKAQKSTINYSPHMVLTPTNGGAAALYQTLQYMFVL